MLTMLVRRAELVEHSGVDVLLLRPAVHPGLLPPAPPAEFAHEALAARLQPSAVIVGDNFRLRAQRPRATSRCSASLVAHVRVQRARQSPLLREAETPLSATYIRSCVQAGDMGAATAALGRPHRLDGAIVDAATSAAALLGFPTANRRTRRLGRLPADGVYAGNVYRLDQRGMTVPDWRLGTAALYPGSATNP